MRIDSIVSHAIPDTRKRPTIETTLTSGDLTATASVPSGKSTGQHEAYELRDEDGGVSGALESVNIEVAKNILGRDFATLDDLDSFLIELDATPNKSRLGANAILSVSIAAMRLSALQDNVPLWKAIASRAGTNASAPQLFVNVINGGVHAGFRLPFQEYMLVLGGKTSTALPIANDAFLKLGGRLSSTSLGASGVPMGDEGGYSPKFAAIAEPFEILATLVSEYPGTTIAIDAAASELYKNGAYDIHGTPYSAEELARAYDDLVTRFPLASIEDPFDENAHADFIGITAKHGEKILIVGDDLTVTDPKRIEKAVKNREINAVLIKPNQIGTVLEAIRAVQETQAAGFKTICSHRSGETDDTFIADFAYGVGAYGLKAGGLGQPERLAKYNRLLAIEREATLSTQPY